MNLCIVHRDRRGAMARIEPAFEELRDTGVQVLTVNADALDAGVRGRVLEELARAMTAAPELAAATQAHPQEDAPLPGAGGGVRVLLHAIAFGNLKLLAPTPPDPAPSASRAALARALGIDECDLARVANELFGQGHDALDGLADPPTYSSTCLEEEDFERTVFAMGTSLVAWTQDLLARGLFAADARVLGLTSEGNEVAWRGYAAVSAAKTALEAVARSMAVELAPRGVRANVIQAGVTDTPALRAIPGYEHLRAQARRRNPFRRLTTPEDVAAVVCLLASDEAAWINGEVVRVDGGEHVSGAAA